MSDLSAQLFEQIIQHDDQAIVITENHQSDWSICYVNNAFTEMTGYAAEEVLGKNPRFLQAEDKQQSGLSELHDALNQNRSCSVTLRNYTKNGEAFWNRLTVKPLLSKDGRITHHVGRMENLGDITPADLERVQRITPRPTGFRDLQTGLYTQEYFESHFLRDWNIWQREGKEISLAIFTPDHFDIYRSTFGASAADSALRKIAYIINSSFQRASDLSARFYEDSILCLMLGDHTDEDETLLKGIATKIDNLLLHNPHAPDTRYLTVSYTSISTLPAKDQLAADFLNKLIMAHQTKQHVSGAKTYLKV